jgi:hypothetical protein
MFGARDVQQSDFASRIHGGMAISFTNNPCNTTGSQSVLYKLTEIIRKLPR